MDTLTHEEFIEGYKSGKLSIAINKNKADDFVMSDLANKYNKPAHLFWSWSGILLILPVTIILLFISWKYSIVFFVAGLFIVSASRKSATQFVLQNMLDNEDFFEYVLLHQGAKITNQQGTELKSSFLTKMRSK